MPQKQKKSPPIKEYKIKIINKFSPSGEYRSGIQSALEMLFRYLNNKQKDELIYKKLMLENENANENSYIQAACEVTICAWFAYVAFHTKENYEYEFLLTPPKDVDCAFLDGESQFNVEVKCADYKKQNVIVENSDLVMHGLGRLDGYHSAVSKLQSLMSTSKEPKYLTAAQHMDCKMKDFLLNAQEKFGNEFFPNHLNVLFVCVDDQMDMTKWIFYLNGPRGLFTNESFESPQSYNNVDLVVFTNLYHRHHETEKKNKISSHWDLRAAFNFSVRNPTSLKSEDLFLLFGTKIPLENYDFIKFLKEVDMPEEVKSSLALSYFVGHQVKKGINKFQGYAATADNDNS